MASELQELQNDFLTPEYVNIVGRRSCRSWEWFIS